MKTHRIKITEQILDETLNRVKTPDDGVELQREFRRKIAQIQRAGRCSSQFGMLNRRLAVYAAIGNTAAVEWLLRAGASAPAYGDEALKAAAENGHVKVVALLIGDGVNVRNHGAKALCAASRSGHLAVVCALLAAGANVNAGNEAALTAACYAGDWEIVDELISAGANLEDAECALPCAAGYGHLEVVDVLLACYTPSDRVFAEALRRAQSGGYLEVVRKLLTAHPQAALFNAARVGASMRN